MNKLLAVPLAMFLGLAAAGVVSTSAQGQNKSEIGSLDIKLRTFYFNRDKKDGNADSIAAAEGVRVDYVSPYINDWVGFHASLFASGKFHGPDGKGGTSVLRDEADGGQSSYAKLGQAFLELKLPHEARLNVGRMVLGHPLLEDSDNRATPSSTQAVQLKASALGTSFYVVASDRASNKTDGKFYPYKTNDGREFEVYVIGAERTFGNGVSAHLSYGYADDVVQQAYANLSYGKALSDNTAISLKFHQYLGDAVGDGAVDGVGTGYGSALSNIVGTFTYDRLKATLSYQTVFGDEYDVRWDRKRDETWYRTANAVQRLKFTRADEDSFQLRIDYDFSDLIKGLSLMARYTHGSGIRRDDGRDGSEWERNFEIKYEIPWIDKLSVRWRNSTVRSSETFGSNENRLILNYTIKAF
jgi:hypothetical protein